MSNYKLEDVVTLLWTIENFNEFFKHKLDSPTFLPNSLDNTSWKISLYPKGCNNEDDYISLTLTRCESPPMDTDRIILDCELSMLGEDGRPLVTKQITKHGFVKNHSWLPCQNFVSRDEVFYKKRYIFISCNVLYVRCRMWRSFNRTTESEFLICDTKIEKNFFVWKINNFSRLKVNEVKKIHVKNTVSETPIIVYKFYTNRASDAAIIEIASGSHNFIVDFFCEIKALDCSGEQIDFGQYECSLFDENPRKLPPFLKLSKLLGNRTKYLPMDVLSLRVECYFWTKKITDNNISHIPMQNLHMCENLFSAEQSDNKGKAKNILPTQTHNEQSVIKSITNVQCFDKQCMTENENNELYLYMSSENACEKEPCTENPASNTHASFMQDMHCVFEDGFLSDFNLCAGNRTFPVHKIILSARSPVFKAMFTTPLKEKDGKALDIPDIDADTLHRMLLFVYSNEIGDLEWEDAINLYFAADKYNIEDLRIMTRSILKLKLSVSNVCEILVHADLHEDQELKSSTMDFIVEHDDEIIGTEDWKKFQKKHIHLTMEILSVLYTMVKKRKY